MEMTHGVVDWMKWEKKAKLGNDLLTILRVEGLRGISISNHLLEKIDDFWDCSVWQHNSHALRTIVLHNLDIASTAVGTRFENDTLAHRAHFTLHNVERDTGSIPESSDTFDGPGDALHSGGILHNSIRGCFFHQHVNSTSDRGQEYKGYNQSDSTS